VPAGIGLNVGYSLRFDDLYKTFQDATARGNIDFNIQRTSGFNTELDLAVVGADRRLSSHYPGSGFLMLDPRRSNLTDPNLTLDRKTEKNTAYALGQGQNAARAILRVAGDNAGDSPFNRIEFVVNANNIQKGDNTGLLTTARTELKKAAYTQTFTYKPTMFEPGNIYNQDWFLGDLITVTYDDYSADLRILGVEIFINNTGETLQTTIGII
jgi:hypothetical protein